MSLTRVRLPTLAGGLVLLALAASAAAQSTAGQGPVTVWGTPAPNAPAASAAPAPAPPASTVYRIAPSKFASQRAESAATGEYFHDFGELIVRVRAVKWIEEICSEAFPASAEANEHAYDDWLLTHGAFVDEMEGQFALIERYWADASPKARKEGLTADQLRARVDANRDGLKQDFHSTTAVAFQRRCDAYPEVLLSPQLDLETSQADYVTSVRLGPGTH